MLAKGILKIWDEKEIEKHVPRAKTRRAPRFAEISKDLSLRSWLDPSSGGVFGAKNFVQVLQVNILSVRIFPLSSISPADSRGPAKGISKI